MNKLELIIFIIWCLKVFQWILGLYSFSRLSSLQQKRVEFKFNWSDHLLWACPIYLWL